MLILHLQCNWFVGGSAWESYNYWTDMFNWLQGLQGAIAAHHYFNDEEEQCMKRKYQFS